MCQLIVSLAIGLVESKTESSFVTQLAVGSAAATLLIRETLALSV
jgi:hypothetical protein